MSPQVGFLLFAIVMALICLFGAREAVKEQNSKGFHWRVIASHSILLFFQWVYVGLYGVYIEPENKETAGQLALALLFLIPSLLYIAVFYIRRRLSRNE